MSVALPPIGTVGALVIGAASTTALFFMKGYAQKAGANTADKTPVLKADTVNASKKRGNMEIFEKMNSLRSEKEALRDKKNARIEEYQNELSDYERIVESIKDENIARKRLIENYWQPLHALVACFTKCKVDTEDGETNFILESLRDGREVRQITGSTYIVPPKDIPEPVKGNPNSRKALRKWIEGEIYADYPDALAHISMFGLVDLRNVYSSSDYEHDDIPHFFSTVDWEFDLEDIFNTEDFSRLLANENVNLTELIEQGDIAFFSSKAVSASELDQVHNEQESIENKLGNPNLKQLAEEISTEELAKAFESHVADPEGVAETIKEEAGIWNHQLYD
jgi:hypothetical protein